MPGGCCAGFEERRRRGVLVWWLGSAAGCLLRLALTAAATGVLVRRLLRCRAAVALTPACLPARLRRAFA